ncbi:MAG: substrate-binding domain-containing protein, partial [Oscillospiraceae bacterium]|nr:substrate-binding domain-containing protein [Oscillospiraceae bacterium]
IPSNENMRLIVLAGKYEGEEVPVDEERRMYLMMYNSVLLLENMCDFDGMIIHHGSMNQEKKDHIKNNCLNQIENVPKVFIASDLEGETRVNYDNESGIREAVDYLVNVNGLSHFCMLGGREDNVDSCARKNIFIQCLKENKISFSEQNYQKTDMSENCEAEANRLLDKNPDVQAIFCVNDSVAKGLYAVMYARDRIPGKDILVFGFDNTHLSSQMIPPLSSIGADNGTLGKKALEVLFRKMNGEKIGLEFVPTRLYGRESFYYEMYDYTELDLMNANPAFIYKMFDDCFYRYKNIYIDREAVNLKRLFYEYMSKMLTAMHKRYMSIETFNEISRMIDKFFEKGAMEYTDASKLVKSIERLQAGINTRQKSIAANMMLNRLFLRMKDQAIYALSEQKTKQIAGYLESIRMEQEFIMTSMFSSDSQEDKTEKILCNIDKLGLKNAAVYLFDTPVYLTSKKNPQQFPEYIRLRCVMKGGELYLPSRQNCHVSDIFSRNELSLKCKGYVAFTLFYSKCIYGILLCGLTNDIYNRGDYLALQLSKAIYFHDIQKKLES